MNDLCALSEQLGSKLKAKSWKLALAESCTGGLLAATLTQLPGSSLWFECGVVSYSNTAKTTLLKVPEAILAEHGAVSPETATYMAQGILNLSAAHIALSITGIAGPAGGSVQKPVGLVYFGLRSVSGLAAVRKERFQGGRAEIRAQSLRYALEWLLASV